MKSRQILFSALLFIPLWGQASEDEDSIFTWKTVVSDDVPPTWSAGLSLGIEDANDDSWSIELHGAWLPLKYAGISLGLAMDRSGTSLVELFSDNDDYDDDDPDKIYKLNIIPALSFRTPTLWLNKAHDYGLLLSCEPGILFSFPANDKIWVEEPGIGMHGEKVAYRHRVRNKGGETTFWRIRSFLGIRFAGGMISLGWDTSNYNIELCRKNMYVKGHRIYGRDHYKHSKTVFLAISVEL